MPEAKRLLSELLTATNAKIMDLVLQLNTKGGLIQRDAESLAEARTIRLQILQVMDRAGIKGVVDKLEGMAADAVGEVASDLAKGPALTGASMRKLESIALGPLQHIPQEWIKAGEHLASLVVLATNTSASIRDVTLEVARTLELTGKQAETLANAAIAGAARAAVVEVAQSANESLAGDDFFVYLYDGPADDDKSRPFCEQHAGRCYTFAEIQKLRGPKGQPGPVWVHCGGYNCRHEWTPITVRDALAKGYTIVGSIPKKSAKPLKQKVTPAKVASPALLPTTVSTALAPPPVPKKVPQPKKADSSGYEVGFKPSPAKQFRRLDTNDRQKEFAALHESKATAWHRQLPAPESQALTSYTGEMYGPMNDLLRGKDVRMFGDVVKDGDPLHKPVKEKVERALSALDKASFPADVIVYRGQRHTQLAQQAEAGTLAVGTQIELLGFTSTSIKRSVATGFMAGRRDETVLFEIRVRKGSKAVYVDGFSENRGEKEVLLQHKLKLHILSYKKSAEGYMVITAELV